MTKYPPIQVVNEQDEPVRGMPIEEVYKQGLIYRVVYIVVEDEEANILLQKRSSNMIHDPNCWDISSAGHVDEGEEYLTTATRELYEELGLKDLKLELIGGHYNKAVVHNKPQRRFVKAYKTHIAPDTPIHFGRDEVAAVKWATLAEIKQRIATQRETVGLGLVDCIGTYY